MPNRFLTLDQITGEAMSIIPGSTSEDRLLARNWAYVALREIGPSKDHIQVCTLYPQDFVLKKPEDFHSALDIGLFDASGNELRSQYRSGKKRIHQSRNLFQDAGVYNPEIGSPIEVSEDEFFFHISSNSTDVSYALLRYFKLPVDSEGNPMFPEYVRLAVVLFIRYMWSLRLGSRDVAFHENSWKMARAEARSKNKMPNGLMFKQFAKEWMSMIPNNRFDRF